MNSSDLKLIQTLDWGLVTPEFSNAITDTIVHVFNHNLQNEYNLERTIKFAIGRINWFNVCFKHNLQHEIVFDDIGQNVLNAAKKKISESLARYAEAITFTSERGF